jgi:formylglycine-generating enzyme required for sulfatase activity
MSDSDEPRRSKGEKAAKPMPRLWKSPSEDGEDESPNGSKDGAAKKSSKKGKGAVAGSTGKSPAGKAKVSKKSNDGDEKEGKKVLLEETPALDTVESRQRVRLIVGAVGTFIILLLCWIVYYAFLSDSGPKIIPGDDSAMLMAGQPEAKSSLDQEARFMFNRAREDAKHGRTDLAIEMLEKVIKVYGGTSTAKDAQEALDRPKQNLPLFSDHPTVLAEPEKKEPESAPRPPAVVDAVPEKSKAAQGEATLVLPSNPSEALVTPPSAIGRLAMAKAGAKPRALPSGFQPKLEAGVHASGWPIAIVGSRDGAVMVLIPGGTFTMGNNDGPPAESPAHQVRLSAYYIDQHEVTNEQFRLFLGESHYRGKPLPGKWLTDDKARAEDPRLPVVLVSAYDAKEYAEWAGKKLPTEAQWELAARTTESRRYPWGDEPAKWSRPRTFGDKIDPVMSFPEDASPYGVFDMAGNVEEWTKDWFDTKYFRSIVDKTTDDPKGATSKSRSAQLVVKGGSKTFNVTFRHGVPPEKRLSHLGFRCVLAVEEKTAPSAPPGVPSAPGQGNKPGDSNVPF